MFRADLHCHSTCSDGSLTPLELVQLAHERDLQGLSITDHDSIGAYPAAIEEGQRLGIEIIPGVEFSTEINQHSIHVLAYAFNLDSDALHALCQRHSRRREQRNAQILENLRRHGMPITQEELMHEGVAAHVIGRPHIALAMIHKGYVQSFQEAFKKYIGEGMPCFAKGESISTAETLDIIHQAQGKAVIAHPHLIQNTKILKELLKLPFDGIECYYALYPPVVHQKWLKLAAERNWLVTGGSDFHGAIKPHIPLGCSWTPEESFRQLKP